MFPYQKIFIAASMKHSMLIAQAHIAKGYIDVSFPYQPPCEPAVEPFGQLFQNLTCLHKLLQGLLRNLSRACSESCPNPLSMVDACKLLLLRNRQFDLVRIQFRYGPQAWRLELDDCSYSSKASSPRCG